MSVDTGKIYNSIPYLSEVILIPDKDNFCHHSNSILYDLINLSDGMVSIVRVVCFVFIFYNTHRALLLPIQILVTNLLGRLRRLILKKTDSRIKLISELLQSMKIIKFFSWEDSFLRKISKIRKSEVTLFSLGIVLQVLFFTLMATSPIIVSCVGFLSYSLLGNKMNPQVIFPGNFIIYF
jgi:hypothetical protein